MVITALLGSRLFCFFLFCLHPLSLSKAWTLHYTRKKPNVLDYLWLQVWNATMLFCLHNLLPCWHTDFAYRGLWNFRRLYFFFFYSGGSRVIGDSHRQASFGMALATIAHHHHYKALAFGAPSNVLRMCIFLLAFLFVCLSPLGQSVLLKCVTALSWFCSHMNMFVGSWSWINSCKPNASSFLL